MENEKKADEYIRTIYRTQEFDEFYASLPLKTRDKFDYVINIIATIYKIPTKFVKHLEDADLYEMRVSVGTNEYRSILFAIDHQNFIQAQKVILLNTFLKKSSKDYKKNIEKALSILNNLKSWLN